MSSTTRVRYVGDDWTFPLTYTGPSGPVNLTDWEVDAVLFYRNRMGAAQTTIPATMVNAGAGRFEIFVIDTVTNQILPDIQARLSTRLQVRVTDPQGKRETLGVFLIPVVQP